MKQKAEICGLSLTSLADIFANITSLRNSKGEIVDPYLGVSLPHQYHYGHYVLCATMLHKYRDDPQYESCAISMLATYRVLAQSKFARVCPDFNLEAILLAHFFSKSMRIQTECESILTTTESAKQEEISAFRAFDFQLLNYLVNLYKFQINVFHNKEWLERHKQQLLDRIADSRVLFDSESPANVKIPDAVYHCRNLEIVLLISMFDNDSRWNDVISSAIPSTYSILTSFGSLPSYGRSIDSLYGQASLAFVTGIAVYNNWIPKSIEIQRTNQRLLNAYLSPGRNHFHLNPAQKDRLRTGYDSYMYFSVYNTYALGRILCMPSVARELSKSPSIVKIPDYEESNWFFEPESGYLNVRSNQLGCLINLLGHPEAPIFPQDPRYSALSIANLSWQKEDIAGSISFRPKVPYVPYFPKSPKFWMARAYSKYRSLIYSPGMGYFGPAFSHDNCLFVPYKGSILSISPKEVSLRYSTSYLGKKKATNNDCKSIDLHVTIMLSENSLRFTFSVHSKVEWRYFLRIAEPHKIVAHKGRILIGKMKIELPPFQVVSNRHDWSSSGKICQIQIAMPQPNSEFIFSIPLN